MGIYIKVKDLVYSVPKFRTILDGVNLEIRPGEFCGLLGKNGAGKTTLMDILMGFRDIDSGQVEVFGEDPQVRTKESAQRLAYLSQDVKMPSFYSLEETLRYHSYFYPNYDFELEKRLLSIFELNGHQKIGGLSTGQSKKVQIVANLSTNADFYLVDEITAFLDPKSRYLFFKELEALTSVRGKSVLLATNITEDLEGRVHKVFFLADGKILVRGGENLNDLFEGAE
ncbi:MAG: ATP-binding cassette domain-containing protein [Bacteriovoracaceae bacterium]